MRFLDRPVGSVMLCDVVHLDRGKVNILGAGWSACPPGPKNLQMFIIAQVPVTDVEKPIKVDMQVSIWRRAEYVAGTGDPIADVEMEADLEFADDTNVGAIVGNMALAVELDPQTDYSVVLTIDDHISGFARFETFPASGNGTDDGAGSEAGN